MLFPTVYYKKNILFFIALSFSLVNEKRDLHITERRVDRCGDKTEIDT